MRNLGILATIVALAPPSFAFDCPAKGGSQWHEYRTTHFILDTEVSQFKAESLLKDLEQLRALVLQGLFGEQVEIPGRMRVVAPTPPHFRELSGSSTVGAYFKASWLRDTVIVLPVEG